MRRVRCVSPHGGAHHGIRADNDLPAPEGYQGALKLPPNEGGWVDNPMVLGMVAVGSEVDAPEAPEFIADGFHFVNEAGGPDVCQDPGARCWCGGAHHLPAPPAETPSGEVAKQEVTPGGSLADLLRKGEG